MNKSIEDNVFVFFFMGESSPFYKEGAHYSDIGETIARPKFTYMSAQTMCQNSAAAGESPFFFMCLLSANNVLYLITYGYKTF